MSENLTVTAGDEAPYIDPFLEDRDIPDSQPRYFLMEVVEGFDPSTVPDLQVFSKLGRIWAASGTKATLDALKTSRGAVRRVESSR